MSAAVRAGYKLTEVGVIPEDWDVLPISSVLRSFQNGFAFASDGYVATGVPIVTMAQIGLDGSFQYDEQRVNFWPASELSQLSAFHLFQGDLLIAMTDVTPEKNLIGRMTEVAVRGPLLLNQRVGLLRVDKEKFDAYFLRAISHSRFWRNYSRAVATLGVQANIGKKEILAGKIQVPPLPEQRAIATALSDVDALLAKLDALIAKKRDLKVATMQQLLTGQTRLPRFSGEWEVVTAGDIGRFRGGSGFPIRFQGTTTGEFPIYKVSDMNNVGNETFMKTANNYISEEMRKQLGATAFPAESSVFAKVGAAVFLERKKILTQPSCLDNNMAAFILDRSRTDYSFIHYVLLNTKLSSLVSTTALPSLSGSVLAKLEMNLPPRLEQTAIATILSDMDAELTALEARRDKTRALKQGMMQELLTGRIRLVASGD